ncbi:MULTISPECIES: hypothetical protein [unclassified Sulfitobacter]|uniref:hypothetical protein n=1 Tax=Sulfitobacter TaxID=60136 RepID=UPI0020C7BC0F|nr:MULTISPECIES: hypothetical protein [unclassified Sulfitobacter]
MDDKNVHLKPYYRDNRQTPLTTEFFAQPTVSAAAIDTTEELFFCPQGLTANMGF